MIDSSSDLPNNQTTVQGCPTVLMAESKDSSGVTIVAICMTIMALCAVAYFTLRWYFEERRLRCSAQLCKCGPAALANAVECGDLCRYSEKRAVNVAVQTNLEQQQQHPATSSCWTTSDVRMSEARRNVCAFSSPMANINNEAAAPTGHWRPPVSGSSTRRKSLQMSQQGRRFYHHHNQHQRRSRTIVPSVKVNSPSSSDSYSILTNNSKMAALNKDLTAVTFSDEEEERILSHHRNRHLEISYASAFHPRYNTPVSETNEECVSNNERQGEEEGHSSAKEVEEEELRDDEGAVGGSRSMGDGDDAGKLQGTPTANTSANQADLKRYQTTGNLATATAVLSTLMPIDTIRFAPPSVKDRFPSYETLPGGRFITRWTQTGLDNASQAPSLDWDHYDWERLRSADPMDEDLNQFQPGESGSATLLMASHNSETTLHAMSQRSASSPYVLCFSCSGEFNINEDRRNSTCVGRRTSSPDPRSSTLTHQPYLAPPGAQPNFLTPSPSHHTSRIPRLCSKK